MKTFDERVSNIMNGLGIDTHEARMLIKSHIRGAYFDGCNDEAEQWAKNNDSANEAAISAAVQAENEACAKIARDHESTCGMDAHDWHECGKKIEAAIRARHAREEQTS